MVTIQQLMTILSGYPPETTVLVDGYEGAYQNVEQEHIYQLDVRYAPDEGYYGDYKENPTDARTESIPAIVIGRKRKGGHY